MTLCGEMERGEGRKRTSHLMNGQRAMIPDGLAVYSNVNMEGTGDMERGRK